MTKPTILRRSRVLAAALLAGVTVMTACGTGSGSPSTRSGDAASAAVTSTSPSVSASASTTVPTTTAPTSTKPSKPAKTVRVQSQLNDGAHVGVGMPIVLSFNPAPTDSTEFTKNATVTVNGNKAHGAWFWERPFADQPLQAHYRTKNYWPANATIKVALNIAGKSAGTDSSGSPLIYSDKLTSVAFTTGDRNVLTVDGASLRMQLTKNGQLVKEIPVSLGATKTPTYSGTKVVMQKGEADPKTGKLREDGTVLLSGPGYKDLASKWAVRLTASGEYLHSAPWNNKIGGQSTSHGCTNMSVRDAKTVYDFVNIGDVVVYRNTGGTKMPTWDGYGDWNVPWGQWSQGGELLNH